jgi:hypothetical protein
MKKIKIPLTTTIVILVITGLALTLTTFAAVTVSKSLSSTGTVSVSPNLGLYSDSGCTTTQTTIDWGSATPGSTVTRTVYIKNTGTGASVSLSMAASSWSPTSANGPITLSWNKEGAILAPGQSTAALLTLTVSSSISEITSFSVQINIVGTTS